MASENVGGISISVTGDFSPLDADFQAAVADVQAQGDRLAQAIQDAIKAPDATQVTDAISSIGDAATAQQAPLDNFQTWVNSLFRPETEADAASFSSAIAAVGDAASAAAGGIQPLAEALDSVGASVGTAAGQIDALDLSGISGDAGAAATALGGLDEAAAKVGTDFETAGTSASKYSDAAQAIISTQATLNADLTTAQGALAEIQQAYDRGEVSAQALARAAQEVQSAFSAANPQIKETADQTNLASEAMGGLKDILGALGVTLSLAAFVNFAEDVGQAADAITRADISLTALTGDAGQAADTIEKLDQLGISDGLSMPSLYQAAQSMTALLPAGTDVVGILSEIADGAAVSGKSIDAAASAFDRIANAGTAGAKQLQALGLSSDSLKQTMQDLGISVGDTATQITAAFKALDVHDRIVVLQSDLQNFQGIAQDVAQNTFGGIWHSAMAQWDADIGIIQRDLGKLGTGDLGSGLRDFVTAFAAGWVYLGTIVKATVDEIKGYVSQLGAELSAAGQAANQALQGNWGAAAASIAAGFTQAGQIADQTAAKVSADWTAGMKIIGDLANQVPAQIKPSIDGLDHLGASAKTASGTIAQAMVAVQQFDAAATSGQGTVGSLQAAFENTSKAINLVAKTDLPLAIQAMADYNAAMVNAGAQASVLEAGFTEESKLISQLAKSDLPDAIAAMGNLVSLYVNANAPIGLVTAAFNAQEKLINSLAKDDIPAAIAAQDALNQKFAAAPQYVNLLVDGLTNEQKIFDTLSKTNLPAAIAGLDSLADKETALNAPAQVVTNTLDDERSKLDALANTNLPGAIAGLDALADHQSRLNQPTQEVTRTLDDERSKLDQLANTNINAAIAGLDALADKQIRLNQPTQDVTRTLDDERSKLDQLANTNINAAIAGLDALADKQIRLNQPTQDVTRTLDDERSKLDQLANTNLSAAIAGLDALADKQIRLNQPTRDVTATLDDERSKLDALANTNLAAAIDGLGRLADKQVALNQPTHDVTATLDDERAKILDLANSNIPGALTALQSLIDKQIALKQPIDDVNTSIKAQSDLATKLANTDLPAADRAYQAYLDDLNKTNGIYQAINAAGVQTVSQLQFQIDKQKELLASVDATNLSYGDRLTIEGKIASEEANLATAQGQYAGDYILAQEKIKLQQQSLIDSTHGMADAIVASITDVLKGFDQLGQSIATVIVNGGKLSDALIAEFKKIATSILGDLINGALKPLEKELVDIASSLLPDVSKGFGLTAGAAAQFSTSVNQAADQAAALADEMSSTGATIVDVGGGMSGLKTSTDAVSGSMSNFSSSLTGWISAIGAVIGAIAGIVGDVYLAAIDTKLFHLETTDLEIRNEVQNLRADAWSQFGQMYQRFGEVEQDTHTMLATLQAMYAEGQSGAGGGIGEHNTSNLDKIAQDSDYLVTGLQNINNSIQALIQPTNATAAATADTDQSIAAIESFLYVINNSILAVVSAVQYGSHAATDALSQSVQADRALASSIDQTTAAVAAGAHLVSGSVDGGAANISNGIGGVAGRVGDLGAAAAVRGANELAQSQAQLAAALSLADQITALQGIIQADDLLMQAATASGDLALAEQYRQAAANATAQLTPLLSATNAGLAQVNTGMSNTITAVQNAGIDATNAGMLVSTAVGQNAVTVSTAIYTTANNIASAFSAAIAALAGVLTSVQTGLSGPGNPYNGGGTYGTGTSTSGGTGGTSPYGPSLPPGTPGAGGFYPLPPAGPTIPPPAPGGNPHVVPLPPEDLTPHYATGGAVSQDTYAFLDAGETVINPGLTTALASFLDIMGNPAALASGGRAPVAPPSQQSSAPTLDTSYIAAAVAAAIATGLQPLAVLQQSLANSIASGASADQIEILRQEVAYAERTATATTSSAASGAAILAAQNTLQHASQQLADAMASGNMAQIALAQQAYDIAKQQLTALQSTAQSTADTSGIIADNTGNTYTAVKGTADLMGQVVAGTLVGNSSAAAQAQIAAAQIPLLQAQVEKAQMALEQGKFFDEVSSAQLTLLQQNLDLAQQQLSEEQQIAGAAAQTNSQIASQVYAIQQVAASVYHAGDVISASGSGLLGAGPTRGTIATTQQQQQQQVPNGFSGYNPYTTPDPRQGGYQATQPPSLQTGGQIEKGGVFSLEPGEAVLQPDVSAMLRNMASTPSMSASFPNPAAGAAVAPVQFQQYITFNVSGNRDTAQVVRDIAAYMKTTSPKMAALSS